MGSQKRLRKTKGNENDSDSEGLDELENGNLMIEEEISDDDYDEEEDDENSEGEENMENDNNDKDAEIEELEKDYKNLRNRELDLLKNLKRHKDEDLLKGQAVKNQKALWDKTLEFRFLLQKAFSSSNRLPQEPIRSSFCNSDGGVKSAYDELVASTNKTLESLLELQEALLKKNPTIDQASPDNSGKKHSNESKNSAVQSKEEWSQIFQMHQRIASFRDKSIDKWYRKTRVTSGAAAIKGKLLAFDQDLSEQVASYMRDPSRMTKQMQLSRSTVGVLGTVLEKPRNSEGEEASPDGEPELLDDSEFYQQLLKEFFETVDPSSSEMAFYALKKLRTKKRKIVDRRASKSRKIRYNVHEKIVNFIAPRPVKIPSMAPKLFENLFGLKKFPASAV